MDLLSKSAGRALPYSPVKDAVRVPVTSVSGERLGEVFEGVNVKRGEEGGTFLVFQSGTQQQAMPTAALSAAIYGDVIPRAGIAALHAAADADAAADAEPAPEPAKRGRSK